MPCFKGIAVSVHAEGAPLPEYSVQKQSRVSRVNTFIPVPKLKIPKHGDKLEPSKFAISITLLTPNLPIPYSQPKPTPENPFPSPQIVADLPGLVAHKGGQSGTIGPYIPITKSENETIAAYIYFDGRKKEEVATLLRPGEETWVNSRWVQVPNSDGGGLAEREFLFREVGLERWLNGLDLDGRDAAAKIERRRQKYEMRRRRRKVEPRAENGVTDISQTKNSSHRGILRYGDDEKSPLEQISDGELSWSSDDDEGPPESAGQIKVAMYRVLASGEIKRGEYSPQHDAHDDEEEGKNTKNPEDGSLDHTTCFAKPKTLDPKSVSTQTVTGIDGPDKPFAVFTFFYRGERQLQKMGIISPKMPKNSPESNKRRSTKLDFSNLNPLKLGGTVGFSTFREQNPTSKRIKSENKSNGSVKGLLKEDSDDDEDSFKLLARMEDDHEITGKNMLSPEDVECAVEIADGVERIKLKRQHSAEPLSAISRKLPGSNETRSLAQKPPDNLETVTDLTRPLSAKLFSLDVPENDIVGSPLKKARASLQEAEVVDNQTVKQSSKALSSSVGISFTETKTSQGCQILSNSKVEEDL
ncbi:hypothetical protein OnM2_035002 [Erysiphe neolycopersici]|uniref:DUF7918 domain-containing protein n=1 Tax=Erysiphe neolycopersici TaxID=212602 RepID=A0A420HXW2_9PEZI|nr:hypothetical protein OnM2_035002 [Erysiphe neolycopersici]